MKTILITALAAGICGVAATTASAQETVTGAPRGITPVTVEGYGPSSIVVCNSAGYCWQALERYDYSPTAQVEVHPYGWTWNDGDRYAWREHTGRGYWMGDQREAF